MGGVWVYDCGKGHQRQQRHGADSGAKSRYCNNRHPNACYEWPGADRSLSEAGLRICIPSSDQPGGFPAGSAGSPPWRHRLPGQAGSPAPGSDWRSGASKGLLQSHEKPSQEGAVLFPVKRQPGPSGAILLYTAFESSKRRVPGQQRTWKKLPLCLYDSVPDDAGTDPIRTDWRLWFSIHPQSAAGHYFRNFIPLFCPLHHTASGKGHPCPCRMSQVGKWQRKGSFWFLQ